MLDDKYDLMRHPKYPAYRRWRRCALRLTQAKDAADDLDYSPEQYDDFETAGAGGFSQTIKIYIKLEECF